MNYDNALNLILQKQSLGIKPGLTRIYELLNKMDNPQDKINIIHIAGTNGKGTTAAALSNALIKSGKKVGLFSLCLTVDLNRNLDLIIFHLVLIIFWPSLLLGLKITVSK